MTIIPPPIVAALVARFHGQVILTAEEISDAARRLVVGYSTNDSGEFVITTSNQQNKPPAAGSDE